VREQLLLGEGEDGRIAWAGPEVVLAPEMALHLAMVLHELGTNARKHGALSVAEGRLLVRWAVEATGSRMLRLRWTETGGPKVTTTSAAGFGTILIEQSVKAHGGATRMLSEAEGVSWEIGLPLPKPPELRSAGPAPASARKPRGDGPAREEPVAVAGGRVLVVEDEPVLALDIAGSLAEAGMVVVGPAGTVEEAARLIEAGRLDAALVDGNLNGHPSDEIAAALTRRNVPFAFVTGYGRGSLPPAFRGAPLVAKPFNTRDLVEAARQLLAQAPDRLLEDDNVLPLRGRSAAV
jgi:CheY-like chemotaxis protein